MPAIFRGDIESGGQFVGDGTWNWWRLIAYTAIIGIAYIGTQLAGLILVGIVNGIADPDFDFERWGEAAGSNGTVVSIATLAAAAVSIPLIPFLVGRVEENPWAFLGFRRCRPRHLLIACGAMVIFIVASDSLSVMLGRPIVPQFMVDAYTSARFPVVLFVALAVAAPLVEELIFRGFIFGGLRACNVPVGAAVIIASVAFAILHVQYDAYDVTIVFLIGLLLMGARVRFDSIVPAIAMHSLTNTIAFAEVVVLSGS
jgi:membrane protease YdiL (CAAX protease family)